MESDIDSIQFQIKKMITNFESKFPFLKIDGISIVKASTFSTEKEQLSIDLNVSLALKNAAEKLKSIPAHSFIDGGIVKGDHNAFL